MVSLNVLTLLVLSLSSLSSVSASPQTPPSKPPSPPNQNQTILDAAMAAPPPHASTHYHGKEHASCVRPAVRKEWRTLTQRQKKTFLKAVRCLTRAKGSYENLYPGLSRTTRFEDFVYIHKIRAPYIHFTGQFFAWHRFFVHAYETALRESCGYDGAHPYWDIAMDSTDYAAAPVWAAGSDGFGGNGVYVANNTGPFPGGTGGGCITTGPFKDLRINIAHNNTAAYEPRCIERSINPLIVSQYCTPQAEANIHANATSFVDFWLRAEGNIVSIPGVHTCGHLGIGGSNSDPYISPSDPLFYLHHANMDRIWTEWQAADPKNRLLDVGGPFVPITTLIPYDPALIQPGNVTLDTIIDLGPLGGKRQIRELMDTKGGNGFCYTYEKSPRLMYDS